jgi:hypothetical protein
MPDIELFFVGAGPNDNDFLVVIRIALVRVKPRGEVAAGVWAAIKEWRRGNGLPASCRKI